MVRNCGEDRRARDRQLYVLEDDVVRQHDSSTVTCPRNTIWPFEVPDVRNISTQVRHRV